MHAPTIELQSQNRWAVYRRACVARYVRARLQPEIGGRGKQFFERDGDLNPGEVDLKEATSAKKIPTVGKLTFRVDGVVGLNCTATVFDRTAAANSEELIVTAAHCLEGTVGRVAYTSTNLVFSPMWHDGKNPFGTWTVEKAFLNRGWLTCSIPVVDCKTNQLYDYAVVVLRPKNGKGIGDVTGADGWSINQPKTIAGVTIAGIPATSPGTSHPGPRHPQPPRPTANTLSSRESRTQRQRAAARAPAETSSPVWP